MTAAGSIGRSTMYLGDSPACFAGFLVRFRANDQTDPRFILHWTQSRHYWDQILTGAVKSTIENFSASRYRALAVPEWNLTTQRRIADFLDDRVGRIDHIIAARRAQLQAVDETLNSHSERLFTDAPITTAPKRRLATLCSFFSDGDWIESPFITDEGIRLVQTGNIGVGAYVEQGFRFISETTFRDLRCTPIYEGDMLISRLAAPVARACLLPDLGPAICSVDVAIARFRNGMLPEFAVEYFSSPRHLSDSNQLARGSTLQRVSRSQVGSMTLPVPTVAVQQQIAEELQAAREGAHLQRRALTRSIDLLAEYKQSLITAAVTGQLDVTTASTRIPE